MTAANATIAALKVSLGLDSAQFETGLRDASATMQREAKKQAAAAQQLSSRVTALKSSLDPVYAAQKRVGAQMKEAQDLYRKGALSGAEYGKIMGQLATKLKGVSTAQTLVASTQRTATQSSKALQQAGLNLSRQFADVGVSLAGGLNPMMVLIQQGPQVADAFSMAKTQGLGFSAVIKGLVGSISPLTVGLGLAVGGVALLGGGFLAGQKEAADLANTLKITGQSAELTGQAFGELARTVSNETNTSIGQARSVLTQLAETGQFAGDAMRLLALDIVKLSQFTGKSADEFVAEFSKMGSGVSEFAAGFNRQYKLITAAQYEYIRSLEEAGRTSEAQLALATALHEELGRLGPENLGYVESAWRDVANAISGAINALKEFGRPENQLSNVNAQIAQIQSGRRDISRDGLFGNRAERRLEDLQVERLGLQFALDQNKALAETRRLQADGVQAADRLANKWSDLSDNTARARREVESYRKDIEKLRAANPGSSLIPSAAQQKQAEEAIRKRFSPSARGGRGPRDASEQAVDAAIKAEIAARSALTKNVEEVALLRRQEIDAELQAAKNRIERSQREGSITAAAAELAAQKYEEAATAKRILAAREEEADIARRDLAQRQLMQAGQDRLFALQSDAARNAAEINAIEMQALQDRQALDAALLDERTKQQVIWGEITERAAAELTIAQLAVQQAERKRAARAAELRTIEEATVLAVSGLENERDLLESVADASESTRKRAMIGLDILAIEQEIELLKAQEAVQVAIAGSVQQRIAEARLNLLKQTQVNERIVAERRAFEEALQASTLAFMDLANDIRRADIGGALQSLSRVVKELGGPAGLSQALGAASAFAALGATTNSLLGIGQNSKTARIGGAAGGALGGLLVAGPVGAIIGALAGGLLGGALAGKPTNAGAGVSLVTGAVTGNKRTPETEQAAKAVAEAIKAGQDAVRGFGVTLTETIHGVVVGTRDLSQIYTTAGRTITAAVGDVEAAVEAGLRAVLETATYASEAQKAVAEKALAAGQSFDQVVDLLSRFEAAQGLEQALADQILQLVDPKAFDIKSVKAEIEAQRKAYADLTAEGYLTADQLATINAQLSTLEGLRLDEVLSRYTQAVTQASLADTLQGAADSAAAVLLDTYNAFAQAKEAEIAALRQTAEGLRAFRRELTLGDLAGRNPTNQLDVLRQEFARLSALPADNPERTANLESVGRAFVEASKAASPDELAFRRDLAAVKRATEASQIAADAQADTAQAQLDAQTGMLTQLGLLTNVTQDMAVALKNYLATQEALKTAGVANDNFNAAGYLAANPDLSRNFLSGGSLTGVGATLEEAARAHYMTAGQYEIAAGQRTRGFATGGQFTVGGHGGIDSQLMQFWASPGEMVSVSHGDPQSGIAAEVRGLRSDVNTLTNGLVALAGYARRSEKFLKKWDGDGLPTERVVA